MKPKSFIIIVILLCVVGSAAFLILNREKPSEKASRMGKMLFEDFPLNDIHALKISSFEKGHLYITNLKKTESEWIVQDLFEFPANFKTISDLVDKFKESKIGRQFEGTPDVISRLALHDPSQADVSEGEKAIRIQIFGPDQKSLVDMLVGKQKESAAGAGAHFLKPTGENTVYLVDQTFRNLGKQPRNWIKTDLFNIPSEDIETVTCINSNYQNVIYMIKRPEKGASPEFQTPVKAKPVKARTVDLLFDVLSSLSIQDVAGFSGEVSEKTAGFKSQPFLEFQLFDGTLYRLYPGKKVDDEQGGYYLKVEIFPAKPEKQQKASTVENPEETGSETRVEKDKGPSPEKESEEISGDDNDPEESAVKVRERNQKLSQWIYVISDWEHQSLVTDPEEFYEKLESTN